MTTKVTIEHEGKKDKNIKIELLNEFGDIQSTNILQSGETLSFHIDKKDNLFIYEIQRTN